MLNTLLLIGGLALILAGANGLQMVLQRLPNVSVFLICNRAYHCSFWHFGSRIGYQCAFCIEWQC